MQNNKKARNNGFGLFYVFSAFWLFRKFLVQYNVQDETNYDEAEWATQYSVVIDSSTACEENGDQNNCANNNQKQT